MLRPLSSIQFCNTPIKSSLHWLHSWQWEPAFHWKISQHVSGSHRNCFVLERDLTWTCWFSCPGSVGLTCHGSNTAIKTTVGHLIMTIVGSIVLASGREWDTSWLWTYTWFVHFKLYLHTKNFHCTNFLDSSVWLTSIHLWARIMTLLSKGIYPFCHHIENGYLFVTFCVFVACSLLLEKNVQDKRMKIHLVQDTAVSPILHQQHTQVSTASVFVVKHTT